MILDLQEHILKRLPRNARAGTARLLNHYYATLFADEIKIYTKDANLPDEVLYRLYRLGTEDLYVRALYARAGAGDQYHVQWLRAQDPPCPWDEDTCKYAALGGHLEVLQWLREQEPPCPWDEDTCLGAADGGHLEVLKWLREQEPRCPWDMESILRRDDISDEVRAWMEAQV